MNRRRGNCSTPSRFIVMSSLMVFYNSRPSNLVLKTAARRPFCANRRRNAMLLLRMKSDRIYPSGSRPTSHTFRYFEHLDVKNVVLKHCIGATTKGTVCVNVFRTTAGLDAEYKQYSTLASILLTLRPRRYGQCT